MEDKKKYCLTCVIRIKKKPSETPKGGQVATTGNFNKTASLVIDNKTGEIQGWKSIYAHLNAIDTQRAEEVERGMKRTAPT
jgi:hypothetical protein